MRVGRGEKEAQHFIPITIGEDTILLSMEYVIKCTYGRKKILFPAKLVLK